MASFGSGSGSAAAAGQVTIAPVIHFHGVTDKEEMLRAFAKRLGDEAAAALLGLHADVGIA